MAFCRSQDGIRLGLCTWLRRIFLTPVTLYPNAGFVTCSYFPPLSLLELSIYNLSVDLRA